MEVQVVQEIISRLCISLVISCILCKLIKTFLSAIHAEAEERASSASGTSMSDFVKKLVFLDHEFEKSPVCDFGNQTRVGLDKEAVKISDHEVNDFNFARIVDDGDERYTPSRSCVEFIQNEVLSEQIHVQNSVGSGFEEKTRVELDEEELKIGDHGRRNDINMVRIVDDGCESLVENVISCDDEEFSGQFKTFESFGSGGSEAGARDLSESKVSVFENEFEDQVVDESPEGLKSSEIETESMNDEVKILRSEENKVNENYAEVYGDVENDVFFDDWEGIERTELERQFGAAVAFVGSKSNAYRVSHVDSSVKKQLCGLHKIAIEGPCPCYKRQPMAFRVSARAKWHAWKQLGEMSQEVAMEQYITLLSCSIPEWMTGSASGK